MYLRQHILECVRDQMYMHLYLSLNHYQRLVGMASH